MIVFSQVVQTSDVFRPPKQTGAGVPSIGGTFAAHHRNEFELVHGIYHGFCARLSLPKVLARNTQKSMICVKKLPFLRVSCTAHHELPAVKQIGENHLFLKCERLYVDRVYSDVT